jgi:ribosomal protein L11 methyltransferase
LGAEGFEIGGDADLREIIDNADPDLIDEMVIGSRNAPLTVTVYIPANEQGRAVVTEIESFVKRENLEHEIGEVAEANWENEWKKHFKPFEVGERLVIKPSWEEYDNRGNRIVLEIDPASAFGTGQHATTRMCLELLEKYCGTIVLDVGCGSGILSAAALLLGAELLTAVDICENAVRITKETLQINKLSSAYDCKIFCGNLITDEDLRTKIGANYPTVVANITADVIIAMAEIFPKFVGGQLILSGIIAHRLPEVQQALEPNFNVVEKRESEGWVALVCGKK